MIGWKDGVEGVLIRCRCTAQMAGDIVSCRSAGAITHKVEVEVVKWRSSHAAVVALCTRCNWQSCGGVWLGSTNKRSYERYS